MCWTNMLMYAIAINTLKCAVTVWDAINTWQHPCLEWLKECPVLAPVWARTHHVWLWCWESCTHTQYRRKPDLSRNGHNNWPDNSNNDMQISKKKKEIFVPPNDWMHHTCCYLQRRRSHVHFDPSLMFKSTTIRYSMALSEPRRKRR